MYLRIGTTILTRKDAVTFLLKRESGQHFSDVMEDGRVASIPAISVKWIHAFMPHTYERYCHYFDDSDEISKEGYDEVMAFLSHAVGLQSAIEVVHD